MERWRIHKLKVNGFKLFSNFEESYSTDLVVYDGPNGFGKTSLFDAKQLLFCNNLPRIIARLGALKISGNKKFNKSIYQNHHSHSNVSIAAEFKKGTESLYVMRLAKKEDLNRSKNKPNSFNEFKLYELKSFDDLNPQLIDNEKEFWSKKFGDKFLSNFSVLNYLQQDSKSIVVPDACDNRNRTAQISHLLNLDKLEKRIDHFEKLKAESKAQLSKAKDEYQTKNASLEELKQYLTVSDSIKVSYTKLTNLRVTPQWDLESPFSSENHKNLEHLIEQVDLLKRIYVGKNEILKKLKNKQKVEFTQKDEFGVAVRLYHHIDQLPKLNKKKAQLHQLDKVCNLLNLEISKLTPSHNAIFSTYLEKQSAEELSNLLKNKNKLILEHGGVSRKQTEMIQFREKLIQVCGDESHDCPLCGFDYKERTLLISAIKVKTNLLKQQLDNIGLRITQCYQDIEKILAPLKTKYVPLLGLAKKEYEETLHSELITHTHQANRLKSIGKQLIEQGIELPQHYASEKVAQSEQISNVKDAILQSLEPEDGLISNQELNFFINIFGEPNNLEKLNEDLIDLKRSYIQQQHNLTLNASIIKIKSELKNCDERITHLKTLYSGLEKIETKLKHSQTEYMNRTIGQMESLFHIYSGRLLQNYQSGLGVFIDTPSANRKTATMNFSTVCDSQHDATLSMSSGQISALSLSLFLALNKKYAKTAFVFIDDPTQCMDEINIASLSDLLRVELRDRQVIISTHEQDISDYLCYRYGKAGLTRKQINLLKKNQQANIF
ncbi:AAA family ATPase [Flocculibacter collagenilyticus]|uniref:AAA family ATPase n=1 Tax=Flocculibacter collagenilyticus TaxID=2744479 RepID=UPI0018F37ED1|nr:AAA family ATPase [Flocculibacter collagenilyticus]